MFTKFVKNYALHVQEWRRTNGIFNIASECKVLKDYVDRFKAAILLVNDLN